MTNLVMLVLYLSFLNQCREANYFAILLSVDFYFLFFIEIFFFQVIGTHCSLLYPNRPLKLILVVNSAMTHSLGHAALFRIYLAFPVCQVLCSALGNRLKTQYKLFPCPHGTYSQAGKKKTNSYINYFNYHLNKHKG